jgi:hypothetical protein
MFFYTSPDQITQALIAVIVRDITFARSMPSPGLAHYLQEFFL